MKKLIKTLSLMLALLTAFSVLTAIPGAAVTNDAIKAKQNEISGLKALLKEQSAASEAARKKIDNIKNDIENTENDVADLITKIDVLNDGILTTEDLIAAYDGYIELKEEEIRQTEEEMKAQEASLIEFLRYDYESGSSAFKTIEFLLESASLSDFLSSIHYIGTLMDYQEHLMQDLENTDTKYEGQKYDLNVTQNEQREYVESLKEQLEESEKLKAEAILYIAKLEDDQKEINSVLEASEDAEEALAAQIAKAQKEEAELVKQEEERIRREKEEKERQEREARARAEEAARQAAGNASKYGSGGYMWPLPMNQFRISGWFGYEPNPLKAGIRFHKAVDLAANRGVTILASKAGKVIKAQYSSSYGNHVVILHSDGYSTLYAHASKLLVKAGDKVEQGETIALVGTTGASTGNHLHFEIILPDGKTKQDPMDYFPDIYKAHKNDAPRYDDMNSPRKHFY